MNKVKIMTDSNSGISPKEAEKLGVFLVPMPFTINDEDYLEDITITRDKFFEMLANNAEVKTSQPSQYYLEETWTNLLKDYDEVVFIPMMSGLSGTCENAKRYAEAFEGKVHVVDNARISVTQKESVLEAVVLAKQGKTGAEIKEYLESTGKKSSIYIMLNVLKYLKKGGRISPAAATIGDMIKLKPILYTRGDKFEKFAIALSVGQGKKKMIQQIKTELETEFKEDYEQGKMIIDVAHTQNFEEAEKFRDEIIASIPNVKFRFIDPLSLSVSCHIGPGSLAIAICVNNYIDETAKLLADD